MKFLKMHGLGNDFVILDFRVRAEALDTARIVQICDRHFGVGCDQLVVMEPSEQADVFVRFYNGDGSESGACGNATRCVAEIIMRETGQGACRVETRAGVLPATRAENGMITVDMGAPKLDWAEIPLSQSCDTLSLPLAGAPVAVNMGNPHCVFFVDKLGDMDVEKLGAAFETDPLFPQRTNVEFVEVLSRTTLRQKTWERGAGLTLACGSGACAVAVAAVRRGLAERNVEIRLDGGSLFIEWRESDGDVLMTGPVAHVFAGNLT